MLKKYIALLCILSLLFIFAGCSEEKKEDPVVENYRTVAQEFIDEEDYDSAIATLEEGIASTDSEVLKNMLADVQALKAEKEPAEDVESNTDPSEDAQQTDYTNFAGKWAFEGEDYAALTLEVNGDSVKFNYINISASDRIAEISGEGQIAEGKVTYQYDNDGWGNSGTVILEFVADDVMRVEVKDVTYSDFYMFNLAVGKHFLVPYAETTPPAENQNNETTNGGDFDDLIGTHIDTYDCGMPIDIRYRADGTAEAELILPSPIEGVVVILDGRDGPEFYGYSDDGGSDPACQILFFYDSSCHILTAEIEYYHSSGFYESTMEYSIG